MNVYSKWKPGKKGEILWHRKQDKKLDADHQSSIKLVLNFDLHFSMKCGIIYIYIYSDIQHIYVPIYFSEGAKMIIFLN
jgi:hypothetical protein